MMKKDNYTIQSERVSSEEYINFLKRTDLGSQYPKERFEERIRKLVKNTSISLVARNEDNILIGVYSDLLIFAIGFISRILALTGNMREGVLGVN